MSLFWSGQTLLVDLMPLGADGSNAGSDDLRFCRYCRATPVVEVGGGRVTNHFFSGMRSTNFCRHFLFHAGSDPADAPVQAVVFVSPWPFAVIERTR